MKRYLAMNRYIRVDSYRKEEKSYSLQLKGLRPLLIVFKKNVSISTKNIHASVINSSLSELNMRQVQPETLPKNGNFSSCLQNIKLKNNTTLKSTSENFGFLAADDHNE